MSWTATSAAPPELAWELIARPANWHLWAPHVRGAVGLGSPEVAAGAVGFVRLLGVVPVPARIAAKEAARSWTWHVGPALMTHRVSGVRSGGCEVVLELSAPGPLEPALGAAYGPVIGYTLRRLARCAERVAGG